MGKLMGLLRLLLAKEPEALLPKEPDAEHRLEARLSKLVEASRERVKSSYDALGEEIDKAIRDNIRLRTGEWDGSDDNEEPGR